MQRHRHIYIYDPNGFNPYGRELASVLSGHFSKVTHLAHPEASRVSEKGLNQSVVFARSATSLANLLWIVLRSLVRPGILILCWVPSQWHLRIALVLARLSRHTYFIDHNPVGNRASNGPINTKDRLRLLSYPRLSPVVHHGCQAEPELQHLYGGSVYHPSYTRLVDWNRDSFLDDSEPSTCIFFGSARAEKGVAILPELNKILGSQGITLRVRVGKCTPDEAAQLRGSASDVEVGQTVHVPDSKLIREISRARVVVAPYSEVTMSGTAILAASVGTPIVMFESPAMSWLVPPANMIPFGNLDKMSERIAFLSQDLESAFSSEPYLVTPDELDEMCLSSWQILIEKDF